MVVGLPVKLLLPLAVYDPRSLNGLGLFMHESAMPDEFGRLTMRCDFDHPSLFQSPTTSIRSFEHESNKIGHAKQGKAFPFLSIIQRVLIGRLGKVLYFTDGPLIPFQGFVEDLTQLRKSLDDLGILLLQVLGFANALPQVKERKTYFGLGSNWWNPAGPAWFSSHGTITVREVKFPFSLTDGLQLVAVIEVIGLWGNCSILSEEWPDVLTIDGMLRQFRLGEVSNGG